MDLQTLKNSKKTITTILVGIIPILLTLIPISLFAQGDLLLFPKRIVFDGQRKSEIINLTNTGKDSIRYAINFVQSRMLENGSFEFITEPDSGQYFADPYIRYYPRTVFLGPGESQVVKIQCTQTSSLPEGEYRSHLQFRADLQSGLNSGNDNPRDSNSLSIQLIASIGVTVPVILRIGETHADVRLSNLALTWTKDSIPELTMDIHRSGNKSVYGTIKINHIALDGKTTPVGGVNGLAVYTPGETRKTSVRLEKTQNVDYDSGTLKVVYSSLPEYQKIILGESDLNLSNINQYAQKQF